MPDGHDPALPNEPEMTAEELGVIDAAVVAHMQAESIDVPPLPHVVLKLQQLVASDKFSSQDLANIVRADQVLSATVLRYANRGAALRSTPIVDLGEAVARIGARELVDVAFGATLGAQASRDGLLLPVRRLVWQQAVVSAILSRLLAPAFRVAPDVGFLSGLLHDFGKVIALGALEKIVDAGTIRPASVEFWVHVVEKYHVELGVIAATRWNLPNPLPDVIGAHHQPDSAGDARAVVNLVNFADMVAAKMATSPRLGEADVKALAAMTGGFVNASVLERTIEQLPGAVSALTSMGGPPKKNSPTLVKKVSISDVVHCDDIRLYVKKGKEEYLYIVGDINHEGFRAEGDNPLAEGFVCKSRIVSGDTEIECFVNVTTCIQSDKARVMAKPFCLGPDEQRAYTEIVRRHVQKVAA